MSGRGYNGGLRGATPIQILCLLFEKIMHFVFQAYITAQK